MAENVIRVLIVHTVPETAAYISALLGLEPDIALVGYVSTGHEAVQNAGELRPDVVLIGSNLPDIDSLAVVRQVTSKSPRTGAVALVSSDDPEEIRRYMQAGARSFLILPFSSEQLVSTIREVHRRLQSIRVPQEAKLPAASATQAAPGARGKIAAVFGPKGGVGKTTLAVNLAVALRQTGDRQVVLVDGSFSFGDAHLLLNLKPEHTIIDFIEFGQEGGMEELQQVLQRHSSGVGFLARPTRPEHAEMVNASNFRYTLDLLAQAYDIVIVDCPASYDDRMLMVFDRSDLILLVTTPEVGSLYNAGVFITLAHALGFPLERIFIVLNRYDSQVGISVADARAALSRPVEFKIPSRGRELATTLNLGVPIVTSHPNSEVSRTIVQIAGSIAKTLHDE